MIGAGFDPNRRLEGFLASMAWKSTKRGHVLTPIHSLEILDRDQGQKGVAERVRIALLVDRDVGPFAGERLAQGVQSPVPDRALSTCLPCHGSSIVMDPAFFGLFAFDDEIQPVRGIIAWTPHEELGSAHGFQERGDAGAGLLVHRGNFQNTARG